MSYQYENQFVVNMAQICHDLVEIQFKAMRLGREFTHTNIAVIADDPEFIAQVGVSKDDLGKAVTLLSQFIRFMEGQSVTATQHEITANRVKKIVYR